MKKSVLRSAKPYWIYLILTGKKTVEVGKDFPKSEDWDKVVYMYCSKDMRSFNRIPEKDREWMRKYLGKVACRFVCDKTKTIDDYTVGIGRREHYLLCGGALKGTCLTGKEMYDYGKGKPLYGWHISNLKIYDTPKELGEFHTICTKPPTEITCRNCPNKAEFCFNKKKPLTRPFQSWGYVEL